MQLPPPSPHSDTARTRPSPFSHRQRVAIVGGGLSGLCAAYELSRTPELRARFEVTVFSPGWRLGGKLASGRNPSRSMRNEEHGLHVWFGFYDNAFRLAREVYERWTAPANCPFQTVWDILSPQSYTPFGVEDDEGFDCWHFRFARNAAVPGLTDEWAPHELLSAAIGVIRSHLANFWGARGRKPSHDGRRARGPFEREPGGAPRGIVVLDRQLQRLGARLATTLRSTEGNPHDPRIRRLRRAIRVVQRTGLPLLRRLATRRSELSNLVNVVDMFTAFLDGVLDPAYGVLVDFDLDRLNHLELREWLVRHGADPEMVRDWALIQVAYDATFQYLGGDPERPSFEAGTAARFLLRAMFGYRNAAAFLINAGMGEAFISPLYEVLLAQGVRFELFHALRTLDVDPDRQRVRSLIFDRQARVRGGSYQPLVTHGGLRCWLSEPDWSQLEGGDALREAGVSFESRFGPSPRTETRVLHDGVDFDEVVLALPAGVLRGTPQTHPPSRRSCPTDRSFAPWRTA